MANIICHNCNKEHAPPMDNKVHYMVCFCGTILKFIPKKVANG